MSIELYLTSILSSIIFQRYLNRVNLPLTNYTAFFPKSYLSLMIRNVLSQLPSWPNGSLKPTIVIMTYLAVRDAVNRFKKELGFSGSEIFFHFSKSWSHGSIHWYLTYHIFLNAYKFFGFGYEKFDLRDFPSRKKRDLYPYLLSQFRDLLIRNYETSNYRFVKKSGLSDLKSLNPRFLAA